MSVRSASLVVSMLLFQPVALADDWRDSAPIEKKIENLVDVMPGASNLMLQMGDRYKNLYWAGQQRKWAFAAYQAEEMQDLVETLQITRPKRAATAQEFLDTVYPEIIEAAEAAESEGFFRAFEQMRQACMTCHIKNDHAFIELPEHPRSAPSPVLGID